MAKTKIIVRCVPERADFIRYLRKRIPDATFYFHPERDAYEAFLGACRMAGSEPAVHMEDDVLLTKNFRKKLESVITSSPSMVIQFFSMRMADLSAGTRLDRNFVMGQCFYLPSGYSAAIAKYDWPERNEDPTALDLMVGDWLRTRKELYWIHVPNLVDHRQCVSAIDSRRSSHRQSRTFRDPWL